MINKEQAILVLKGLANPQNENKVRKYIEKINSMTNEDWLAFLREKSIDSIEGIEKLANMLLTRRDSDEKTPLNEIVSYGITGNTIHIHTVPVDLRKMLTNCKNV